MTTFSAALATEGLWLLLVVVSLAGLVRGFSGFGTAMIYLPFAASVLDPVHAVITMFIFDLIGPIPLIRRMWHDSEKRDVIRLGVGVAIGVPLGLLVLLNITPEPFRWLVSIITLFLLVLLATGWRYRGQLTKGLVFGTGAMGGVLAGICGLAGPPVIMIYMASTKSAKVIRANIFLFLLAADMFGLVLMYFSGRLDLSPVVIGLILVIPYMIGGEIGARLFNPKFEGIYRKAAYVLIAGAALINLPIWSL